MKLNAFSIALLSLLALFLAGCGGTAEGPPEIRYGEDACDQCQMIISEPRFAAAYVTEDGEFRRFDDFGEMFLYAAEREEAVRTFWVHDFDSKEWLEVDSATFVHDPELVTPMGWGIAAFADESAAETYHAENGGTVLTAAAFQEQVESGNLMPKGMGMSGTDHNHDHADHGHAAEHEMGAMTNMSVADQ